ncbi:hypothetical protein LIER_11208 [Lithospermum erythrorhizon]|uniref:Reverse transcriptase Ty1/copia-type domain-containing protein n=1 Tax=Lithospermum erythrorhizon TaxID=34254 RepID=A0AAV3PM63_LITER
MPSTNSSPMSITIDCASIYIESESGGDVVEVSEPTDGIGGSQVETLTEQRVPTSFLESQNFLAAITAGSEPKSFKEAMQHPEWREAMQKEMSVLEDNGKWSMVELLEGKKTFGTQWVNKVKYNADGSLERYKARLAVFGNHQVEVEGIDYNDTFAPVAKMVTIGAFFGSSSSKELGVASNGCA